MVIPLRDVARIDKVHQQPAIAIIMKSSDHCEAGTSSSGSMERLPIGNAVGSEFVFVEMHDREYVLDKFKHILARVRSQEQAADQAADAMANSLHLDDKRPEPEWAICDPLMTIFQASSVAKILYSRMRISQFFTRLNLPLCSTKKLEAGPHL